VPSAPSAVQIRSHRKGYFPWRRITHFGVEYVTIHDVAINQIDII
jgi:hypothetical protein